MAPPITSKSTMTTETKSTQTECMRTLNNELRQNLSNGHAFHDARRSGGGANSSASRVGSTAAFAFTRRCVAFAFIKSPQSRRIIFRSHKAA